MSWSKRPEPQLPPGAARDLVDLFKLLRDSSPLRIGQVAQRTGYTPSHISEVLRGLKSPSPDAAARIAQVLGADENTVRRARRRAEDLKEWKRSNKSERPHGDATSDGYPESPSVDFPIHYQLTNPDVMIKIIEGNLLDQETHISAAFSDTFDTSIKDDRIVHSSSIQGQLLRQIFDGNQVRLDKKLATALAPFSPVRVESRRDKPYGKLARYPLGTVAVLRCPSRLIFAVAYAHMGNDLVVRTPVEGIWYCFTQLWESVYQHGQRRPLSIPLMGSGLARVDTLDRENLIRLILLSFVAYSRLRLICHELRIVILPGDVRRVDPRSLSDFLQTL